MKVSLITVAYNSENTIIDTIVSVEKQNYYDIEYIIVDGASTDKTLSIIRQHSDTVGKLVSELDYGIYDAMNKGIKVASGEIVGILNADDFYPHGNVLNNVLSVFSDLDVDACYGDLKYVDAHDLTKVTRYWRSGKYNTNKFYWGWMPPHPTFFVRKSVYERFGGFDLAMGSAADYEFMLRVLLKYKIKAVYIPEVLVHMRTGGVSNATLGNRLQANKMDKKAWEVNGLRPYPWTIAMKPLRKITQWFIKE